MKKKGMGKILRLEEKEKAWQQNATHNPGSESQQEKNGHILDQLKNLNRTCG